MRTFSRQKIGCLNPHLSAAETNPFVAGQFIQTHRAARADFVGADADFSAHAKLAAVGETCQSNPAKVRLSEFICG
jgi:hypothetical protein